MRQHGDEVDELDQAGRAEVAHQPLGDRGLLHKVDGLVEAGLVLLRIGDGDLLAALDADGLELLAAPDRTRTAAAVDAVLVVGDGGEADEILPGRPDAEDPGRAARLGGRGQDVVGLVRGLAPEVAGGQDLGPARRDVEHHRSGRGAGDDEGVIAGGLERVAPGPAGVRGPDDPGERRFEDHVAPAGGRRVGADERRGRDDEGVVRTEGIAGRVDEVVEQPGREAPAAEVGQGRRRIEGDGPDLAAREVGDEDAAVVSGDRVVGHAQRLRYQNGGGPARKHRGKRSLPGPRGRRRRGYRARQAIPRPSSGRRRGCRRRRAASPVLLRTGRGRR